MASFYAAECGLKCLFMRMENLGTTEELRNRIAGHLGIGRNSVNMHDIEQLCQAVSVLPVDTGPTPPAFMMAVEPYHVYRIHEAARYGVKLPDSYLTTAETWLSRINDAIASRMHSLGL
jgi:hypothetical protein